MELDISEILPDSHLAPLDAWVKNFEESTVDDGNEQADLYGHDPWENEKTSVYPYQEDQLEKFENQISHAENGCVRLDFEVLVALCFDKILDRVQDLEVVY